MRTGQFGHRPFLTLDFVNTDLAQNSNFGPLSCVPISSQESAIVQDLLYCFIGISGTHIKLVWGQNNYCSTPSFPFFCTFMFIFRGVRHSTRRDGDYTCLNFGAESFLKMGQPWPLFHLFSVFTKKHHYNFYNKYMLKMSIQYRYGAGIRTHDL